jgi:hypothetical protein
MVERRPRVRLVNEFLMTGQESIFQHLLLQEFSNEASKNDSSIVAPKSHSKIVLRSKMRGPFIPPVSPIPENSDVPNMDPNAN